MLLFRTTTGIQLTGKPCSNVDFMDFISRGCEENVICLIIKSWRRGTQTQCLRRSDGDSISLKYLQLHETENQSMQKLRGIQDLRASLTSNYITLLDSHRILCLMLRDDVCPLFSEKKQLQNKEMTGLRSHKQTSSQSPDFCSLTLMPTAPLTSVCQQKVMSKRE